MAIGMSYQEFWTGTASLTAAYHEAYLLQRRMENEKMWLQGYYNYLAVSTAIGNAFRKQNTKATPYLEEPVPLTQEDIAAKAERDRKKAIAFFRNWTKQERR